MRDRFSAALCAAVLLVAVAPPAAAEPARPRPHAANQSVAKDPIKLTMLGMSPQTIGPKLPELTVTAKIVNSGPVAITGLTVRLAYGDQIETRSELNQFANSTADAPGGARVDQSARPFDLPAGGSKTVALTWKQPGKQIGGAELATFPLMLKAVNTNGEQLDAQHSFITYVPAKSTKLPKTKVSFVWPLLEKQAHRTTDEVFVNDALAAEVSGKNRLNTLLTAADLETNPGLTLAIDPGLLDDLNTMASGDYLVDPPGSEIKGKTYPKNANAGTWLSTLKRMTSGGRVPFFFTPYGDPDSVALVHAKMATIPKEDPKKKTGPLGLLPAAYKNKKKGADILGAQERYAKLAWPFNGKTTEKTINQLIVNERKGLGSSVFLLSGSVYAPENLTPSATTSINDAKGRPHRVLTYDDTLQNVISGPIRNPAETLAAEQRYIAETAVFHQEQPGTQRTLVITPERGWSPTPEFARFLLDGAQPWGRWLKPTSLGDVARAPVAKRTPVNELTVPSALPSTYLDAVNRLDQKAIAFGKVFDPDRDNLRTAAMRTASGIWRGGAAQRRRAGLFMAAANEAVGKQTKKVFAVLGDDADGDQRTVKGLTGSEANVQLIVANDYQEPVEVQVIVTSTEPNVLIVKNAAGEKTNPPGYAMPLKLNRGEKLGLQIPMEQVTGSSNRTVKVNVDIYNPAGERIGHQDFDVKTSDIPFIGWLITLGALAVLALGVGFRGMRARRRRKEEEAEHDGAAAG
ncbi:DUF6049 family protein [Actinocorallia lasiicapitis]